MIVGNVETGYQKWFVTFGCRDAKFCVSTGRVYVGVGYAIHCIHRHVMVLSPAVKGNPHAFA